MAERCVSIRPRRTRSDSGPQLGDGDGGDIERVSGDATLRAGNGGVHAAGTPGFLTLEAGRRGSIEAGRTGRVTD
ncbi:hypothetical protein C8039_05475 [Halogeometricum sp. wsp3]|nr:hypothetical protein C8039_05475 [Halogeometricum sp. wsp3]